MEKEAKSGLAVAQFIPGSFGATYGFQGGFYMGQDSINQALGLAGEKLIIPRDYHSLVRMCYDFYQRGGIATSVINRLAELSITTLRNGQRKTSDEANIYFDAVLHRNPSRMMRFIRSASLEYYLSGMVLPRVDWIKRYGKDIHPKLNASREYLVPQFDWYPPLLVNAVWTGWGKKDYYLKIPKEDIKLIQKGGSSIKEQQLRYDMFANLYPSYVETILNGGDRIKIDVDPILRKEISFSPYPTPYLYNVLEALVFKQQLRRMDFAVASRVINAILLVQEGSDEFPLTKETEGNLTELKSQILARANDPRLLERLFFLFSNHTTKLTWIVPDISAMLNQEKYVQANDEISEGLGFARILVTGESRNASASEVSTWAIQPMMEELRDMIIEWVEEIYEEAGEFNKFRNTPQPAFTPIKLQDFVKTAAVFAQAYREGNVSRTTRNQMIGLDFETETELMTDELELMKALPSDFPEMPYNTQMAPNLKGGLGGAPTQRKGGRPVGNQNTAITPRTTGVDQPRQEPLSRTQVKNTPSNTPTSSELEVTLSDEEVINLIDKIARARGITINLETIGLKTSPGK